LNKTEPNEIRYLKRHHTPTGHSEPKVYDDDEEEEKEEKEYDDY